MPPGYYAWSYGQGGMFFALGLYNKLHKNNGILNEKDSCRQNELN